MKEEIDDLNIDLNDELIEKINIKNVICKTNYPLVNEILIFYDCLGREIYYY